MERALTDSELTDLREIVREAEDFLQPFATAVRADWPRLWERIRPRDEDWARVFVDDHAGRARASYTDYFDDPSVPERGSTRQNQLRLTACAPAWFVPQAHGFPSAYGRITHTLQPDPVWVCWRFVEPGATVGMAHNGLVRVREDRWIWLPKPWRHLSV